MKNNYQFPFFGAGDASYFENAEVYILFKEEPSDKIKEKIKLAAPIPLSDIEWENKYLIASNLYDKSIHYEIITAYQLNSEKENENKKKYEYDDEYDDEFEFAQQEQVNQFNSDIEKWLIETHNLCQIICASRSEDYEAGGTELSEWHIWSLNQLTDILIYFDDLIINGIEDIYSPESYMFITILQMAINSEKTAQIPQKYMDFYAILVNPEEKALFLLDKKLINELKNYLILLEGKNPYGLYKTLYEISIIVFSEINKKQANVLHELADLILRFEEKFVPPIIFKAIVADILNSKEKYPNYQLIYDNIKEKVANNSNFCNTFAYMANIELMENWNYKLALELFDFVLPETLNDLATYCNALYAAQNDNSKLGVNKELNYRFLSYSLPYGNKNPDIYFNAACLYVELQEYEKAIDYIELAIKYGSQNIYKAEKEPFFKELFEYERFKKAFKKNNPDRKSNIEAVKAILETGVDINIIDENGKTALMRACADGDLKSVKFLIDNSAEINSLEGTLFLKTPNNYINIPASKETALTISAINGYTDILEYLIKNGGDIDGRDRYGRNALYISCMGGDMETTLFLLNNGANINITDISCNTPLMAACVGGHIEIIKFLIKFNADVNMKNLMGETALMIAAAFGYKNVVKFLLENGADALIEDNKGLTAITKATKCGYNEIVNLLRVVL